MSLGGNEKIRGHLVANPLRPYHSVFRCKSFYEKTEFQDVKVEALPLKMFRDRQFSDENFIFRIGV